MITKLKMEQTIHIEIMKSPYLEGSWCIRIGDIKGSTEHSNCSMKEVLGDITMEMNKLKSKGCGKYPTMSGQLCGEGFYLCDICKNLEKSKLNDLQKNDN